MLCSIRVKGRNFCFSGYLTFVPVYVIGAAAKIMPKRYSWKENGRPLNLKEVFGWKTEIKLDTEQWGCPFGYLAVSF